MADLGPTTIYGDLVVNGSIGGAIRVAYVDGAPGAALTVAAFLDTDTTGEPITVTCSIVDGVTLNTATPRLGDGDPIYVIKIGGTWYCPSLFYTTL
jgi:hypothetical protein